MLKRLAFGVPFHGDKSSDQSFFHETVNAEWYQNLVKQFIASLEPSECCTSFQQDGAKVAAASTKEFLIDFFDDRIIWGGGLWPRRSPNLTSLDFFLRGYIKDHVFQVAPASIDHLKELITDLMVTIDRNVKKCFLDMSRCIKLCKEGRGSHIEYLL